MPPALRSVGSCTGQSSSLDDLQCSAWRDFYNSTGGVGWTRCSDAATDPCSCQPYGLPTCTNASDYGALTIAAINLPSNNLVGELLPSFGALWPGLVKLWLHSNPGLGGALPPPLLGQPLLLPLIS